MRIDPAVAGMQRDPGRQRGIQAAMRASLENWRGELAIAAVLAELERFGAGTPIERCCRLHALISQTSEASRFAAALCHRFVAELAREPLAQLPFRHGFDGAGSSVLLARSSRAQLVLHAQEPGWHDFVVADFSHAVRHETVLAGRGRARIARRGDGGLAIESRSLAPGVQLALDLSREALQVIEVERRLVSLRLHRFAESPGPSRRYTLADGALLHQAAGDLATSRREVALAVLGRMGWVRAAPVMAEIARGPGDPSLRWQALCECLALDSAEGFRALVALAQGAGDALTGPAAALREQLAAAWPALRALGCAPCPA